MGREGPASSGLLRLAAPSARTSPPALVAPLLQTL
jgi:hypothetical protein